MSPEEPPEGMTSFEDRDLRPGELLRWVYGTLPGVLLEDSATDRSAMERSDEEDFKKEVYKGFVGFEAKFSSSSGMHNFESNVKPLDDILINFKRVDTQDPSETVARFRLALQVCVSFFYLFPGPWVQREWSSSLFQAPWGISHTGLSADLTQTSFLCEILKDWDGQNRIYEEFLEAQKNPSTNPPGFFLSLAQLLVDICEGKAGDKSALEYAGTVADIITMSFGLGDAAMPALRPVIKKLKTAQKLIFAAASNSGGNGKRSYPANEAGVFAIHATKGDGSTPENLNPPRLHGPDNFATLGWKIPSSWNGDQVFISGTSFATPVAAAIAANLMEIICRTPTESNGRGSRRVGGYGDMRRLLLKMQHEVGNYQYLRPWAQGMFDGNKDFSEMRDELQSLLIGGESPNK
ncbi:hypothetical protein FOBRF1_015818 [Fusarium oxysporum]